METPAGQGGRSEDGSARSALELPDIPREDLGSATDLAKLNDWYGSDDSAGEEMDDGAHGATAPAATPGTTIGQGSPQRIERQSLLDGPAFE